MNEIAVQEKIAVKERKVAAQQPTSINPITAEIIRHGLLSIPNQIDVNITRTAFSPLIYEYKDYAVGIVDPDGRLICQSKGGIPIFVANALGAAVQDGLKVHGREAIEPGDIIISNHAGTLGQHLNNVVMYTPIHFGADGKEDLFGFMAVLVHWIDVGGITVGSCISSNTTEIFQEGIQFRSTKLWSRGRPLRDIYRIIEVNTRFPYMAMGDLESQIAGCLLGKAKILELLAKYGMANVRAAIELMWQASEAATRDAIRKIPDGVYEASSFLDNDGIDLERRVPIGVIVRVQGDEMTVDFSGVGDQVKGPLNSGREGGAVAAARIALKYFATPDEPANDGSFRPLHVVIPEGKFLSARPGAPLGAYSTPLSSVIDTILKALVPAAPERVAAGHHGTMGIHAYEGRDPKTGELFQNLETSHGGWGASLGHDGPGPYKTMGHGDTRDVPIEAQEAMYPLRIDYTRFRQDSGGAGEFRGGLGLEKKVTALAPCQVRLLVERNGCPAWGIFGGCDGKPPMTTIERPGREPVASLKGLFDLEAGDAVSVLTGAGGGYGDSLKRDTTRVAADVRHGYVSRAAARDLYGVVLDDNGIVQESETRDLRRRLAGVP
jgi:N-methylhydantoinase B